MTIEVGRSSLSASPSANPVSDIKEVDMQKMTTSNLTTTSQFAPPKRERRRSRRMVATSSIAARPDKAAFWAFLLTLFMIVIAIVSA